MIKSKSWLLSIALILNTQNLLIAEEEEAVKYLTAEEVQQLINEGTEEEIAEAVSQGKIADESVFEEGAVTPTPTQEELFNSRAVNAKDLSEFDPGPNLNNWIGRGYAKNFAYTPNFRPIGAQVLGGRGEKFRWKFGPMFYRGRLGENQVKVLIIGQEGAQDENVSYRSFTGGTGGNMQGYLSGMGISKSYLFINTFKYTITGQYTDFGAPMLKKGNPMFQSILTWPMLKLSQAEQSPVVRDRHELIDHIIKANKKSLKLIIAVGGAAKDTLATYIQSKGGECPPMQKNGDDWQMIEYRGKTVKQNRKFYFPIYYPSGSGRYANALLDNPKDKHDYSSESANNALKKNAKKYKDRFIKKDGGRWDKGLNDLKQLGTNLYGCKVPGNRKENSMQGLDGISSDIRYITVRHPGSRSASLEKNFRDQLAKVIKWNKTSWKLHGHTSGRPDPGVKMVSKASSFDYQNRPVPRYDHRFGLADVMTVGRTRTHRGDGGSAIRMLYETAKWGTNASFTKPDAGSTRPRGFLKSRKVSADVTVYDLPNEPQKSADIDNGEYFFDPGPTKFWAEKFTSIYPKMMRAPYSRLKMNDNSFGAWAIFRGRQEDIDTLVLADQFSHDDLWVGRALMGKKGQQLQAYLKDKNHGLDYNILRALPVDTLGAKESNVKKLLTATADWRKEIWNHLMERNDIKTIYTVGEISDGLIDELNTRGAKVVSLTETLKDYRSIPIARYDIPYGMPMWVGTGGNRGARATGSSTGKLYKFFAPRWATKFTAGKPSALDQKAVDELKDMDRL